MRKVAFVAGIFVLAVECVAPLWGDDPRGVAAAFYDWASGGLPPKLHVFPLDGRSFTVQLPFQLGLFAVSPDGAAIYAQRTGPKPSLYKIEFGPTRVTKLFDLDRLPPIYGMAASSTKIVVAAGYLGGGPCGLYELAISSGRAHQILSDSDCKTRSPWTSLSLSPDSKRMVAVRTQSLELIDTQTGAFQLLGEGFEYAAWSPDGRWIAALEYNGDHTVLIDAVTLDKRRKLRGTEVIWSLDSHAILASRGHWYCGPDLATLELIDIQTGKATTVRSSSCKISQIVFGFIDVPVQL
jgi:hypothetical protein